MLKLPLTILLTICVLLTSCIGQFEVKTNRSNESDIAADTALDKNQPVIADTTYKDFCQTQLVKLPGEFNLNDIASVCKEVKLKKNCMSVNGQPIIHFDKNGVDLRGKKIFAMALIHGDEIPSGSVARAWMARLQTIEPRNSWRVLPIVNPDGVKEKTRYNANSVDLNRNFPSKDWGENALSYWENSTNRDKRRYPGPSSGSEPETKCVISHLEEFKPDFVISIHTPLGILDFDGPKVSNPGFKPLPWVGLGNFAGSLGRYMWVDNKIPVLTIELKGNRGIQKLEEFDELQDISGTVAIQALRILDDKTDVHADKKNSDKTLKE